MEYIVCKGEVILFNGDFENPRQAFDAFCIHQPATFKDEVTKKTKHMLPDFADRYEFIDCSNVENLEAVDKDEEVILLYSATKSYSDATIINEDSNEKGALIMVGRIIDKKASKL